jgi:hypothetical protein
MACDARDVEDDGAHSMGVYEAGVKDVVCDMITPSKTERLLISKHRGTYAAHALVCPPRTSVIISATLLDHANATVCRSAVDVSLSMVPFFNNERMLVFPLPDGL